MRQKRNANMRKEKALSGRKLILLFAVSLSAGIIGPLIGKLSVRFCRPRLHGLDLHSSLAQSRWP
jgi:hypothetical protein